MNIEKMKAEVRSALSGLHDKRDASTLTKAFNAIIDNLEAQTATTVDVPQPKTVEATQADTESQAIESDPAAYQTEQPIAKKAKAKPAN